MSFLQRKAIDARGVIVYLRKKGFDVSGRGSKVNKIMVAFLKEKGLPYEKWNYRYKGLNTADLINAPSIQENWKEFKKWLETYKPEH